MRSSEVPQQASSFDLKCKIPNGGGLMRRKFLAIVVVFVTLIFASNAYAATRDQLPQQIKTISDMTDYLISSGKVKNIDDLRDYMTNNKSSVLALDSNLIDYGFTVRFYTEINHPTKDNGLVANTKNQEWVVYLSIMNLGDTPQEISKDSFAIVPHLLQKDNELYVLSLRPEYIADSTTGDKINSAVLKKGEEKYFGVVFYPDSMVWKENVKLRLYDGKDHVDINITKK